MQTTRRGFLGSVAGSAALGTLGAGASAATLRFGAPGWSELIGELRATPGAVDDEDYWRTVGRAFTVDRTLVNFNNGGVSPSPGLVQDAMKRHLDFSNSTPPSVALWRILEPRREPLRLRMAQHWGVDAEEIAFTRNSSESLQICQFGIDLARGDEILTTDQDYPRMRQTFAQRQRREGLVFKQFAIPVPVEDDDELVDLFERNITSKTRLILMCHIINLTGQILPVRKVVAMARRKGNIPVIVDGAHALAHFEFQLSDLDCDYYGTSLHKWLFAPHGTGLLYVRREKIKGLWPLMAADKSLDDDIRKFEQIGTHPAANTLAIGEALTFHEAIGDARKEKRLRFLRDRWAKRLLSASDRIVVHTSLKPAYSCGIATVQITGIDSGKLASWLEKAHGIIVTTIKHAQFEGIRVSPSVYSTLEEIDRFCSALEWALAHGLPE